MKKENKYICIRDLQGGSWAVGLVATIKEWKEIALQWLDDDSDESTYDWLKKKYCSKKLIDFICDWWEIEIVEFDENNKEHTDLQKAREQDWLYSSFDEKDLKENKGMLIKGEEDFDYIDYRGFEIIKTDKKEYVVSSVYNNLSFFKTLKEAFDYIDKEQDEFNKEV